MENMTYKIGIPESGRIYNREYKTHEKAVEAATKMKEKGFHDVVIIPTQPLYFVQYAKYAYNLLKVNPSYVTDVKRYIDYIRGPNWESYAWERMTVKIYGKELCEYLETVRAADDAISMMEALVNTVTKGV